MQRALTLHERIYATFSSVQFFREGIKYSPVYFDLDGYTLNHAFEDAKYICDYIQEQFEITPHIWFSGGKGIHIILPVLIPGESHLAISRIVSDLFSDGMDSLDIGIYTSIRVLRDEFSYNHKAKRFKIPMTYMDIWDLKGVLDRADEIPKRTYTKISYVPIHETKLHPLYERHSKIGLTDTPISRETLVSEGEFLPCVEDLFKADIKNGERNKATYILARYCRLNGLTEQEAIEKIDANNSLGINYIKPVVKSTYKNGLKLVSCRNFDGSILKPYCSVVCHKNPDCVKLIDTPPDPW